MAVLTGGCLRSVRNTLGLASASQVSLQVIAPPVDWDRRANEIAGRLVDRLEQVGVDAALSLRPPEQFREQVLYQRDFDVYVGTMPIERDPDFLRSLLGSTRTNELGWQNPFGFTNGELDERLNEQSRRTGADRTDVVREILRAVASEQPFVPVATDRAIAATRTDAFTGWEQVPLRDPTWLFELEPAGENDGDEPLRVTTKDGRVTEQLNPLVPWINEFDLVTSLVYDPLARYYDGEIRPWLATEWSLDGDELTVTLRPELRWHDGEPVTAEDVKFTYQLVSDTSLDSADPVYPAPTFQQQASLVDEVTVLEEHQVRIHLDASRAVAPSVLGVPLLPEHVWQSRTAVDDAQTGLTQAITHENTDPVGCGPMAVESRQEERSLVLRRVEDHPINREDDSALGERFGPLAFAELVVRVTPSDKTMIEFLEENEADATVPALDNRVVSEIVTSDEMTLATSPSRTLYHVGFNARRRPLRNPGFRRATAHLLNKADIVESIFGGYADPKTSPILDEQTVPEELRWNGGDPEVPFAGVEDELDPERAREHFRTAGYDYTGNGQLVY
ncbi:MAG: ABC transporter substrate-binding protein [Halapricum sp.]